MSDHYGSPNSLLNLISKLLERHIFNILLDHFQDNWLSIWISCKSFNYICSHICNSTYSHILWLKHFTLRNISRHKKGIWLHQPLPLDWNTNLTLHLTQWFSSYLTGHSQSVQVRNSHLNQYTSPLECPSFRWWWNGIYSWLLEQRVQKLTHEGNVLTVKKKKEVG